MAIKVKVRVRFPKVDRRWGKAYIRCQKAADAEGYIYCKDCTNRCRNLPWCPTDPNAHMEFCIFYFSNDGLIVI